MVSLSKTPPETGGALQLPTPSRPEVARAAVGAVGKTGGAPRNPYLANKRTRERPQPILPAGPGRDDGDAATINPRPRHRQRKGATKGRCCNCHRSSGCTNAPQSHCECRRADPPRPCTSCPCPRTCTNAASPSTEGTPNSRQGLLNFAFRIGPVAQAAAAAICTTATTITAASDPPTEPANADEGEDDVVPPPAATPEQEEGGDGENVTEIAEEVIAPQGDEIVAEENPAPTEEDEEEEERGQRGEGAPGLGGEGGEGDHQDEEGRLPPDNGEPNGNPLLGRNDRPDGGGWNAGLDSRQDLLGVEMTEADNRLMVVYGDTIHQNDGRHLHGGIEEAMDAQHTQWFDRVVAHPHKLYFPPRCKVGKKFISLFAGLLRGVIDRRWNSEYPMVFAACILRRNPGTFKAAQIKKRISQRLELWEDGREEALVCQIETAARMSAGGGREPSTEEKTARSFNSTVLDGNLRAAVRRLTAREGGGVMSPSDRCTKTGEKVLDVLQSKHPDRRVPNLDHEDNLAFEDYDRVPEPVPVQCDPFEIEKIARKLNGAAGVDSVDAAHAKVYLTGYGRASAELREVMVDWAEWLANEMPDWAAYRGLTTRRLLALDKEPGTRPVGIGSIWLRYIAKLLLAETAAEAKSECGCLQLCAGLEAGTEGGLHSVHAKMEELGGMGFAEEEMDRNGGEPREEETTVEAALFTQPPENEKGPPLEHEDEDEETPLLTQPPITGGVTLGGAVTAIRGAMHIAMENVATSIPTVGEMAAVFEGDERGNVDVEDNDDGVDVDYEEESDEEIMGDEGDDGGNTEGHGDNDHPPPRQAGPPISLPVDAENGFNNQNRLAMVWTVRHVWPSMAKFTMNLYRHHVRMIVRVAGSQPHIILSKEGVVQGAPEAMVHYAVGMLPLAKKIKTLHAAITTPFYADDLTLAGGAEECAAAFNTVRRFGPSIGYFAGAPKSWVICSEEVEDEVKEIMEGKGIEIQYTRGTRYVGGFIGSAAMEDAWITPQVDAWAEGVKALARVAIRFPQTAYVGLTWSLQAEWQYLSRVSPRAAEHLGPIEDALRKVFLPALFGRPNMTVSDEDRLLYTNSVKAGGLGIRDPCQEATALNQTSKEASKVLVHALVEGTDLSLTGHKKAVKKASATARASKKADEEAVVATRKGQANAKEKKRLARISGCGVWLTRLPTRFEGNQVTEEEWHDNVSLRYGMRPVHLPQQCDGCGANFTIEHALNCKKGGLVTWRHNDVQQEWADLLKRALPASSVGTEPYIFYGLGVRAEQRRNAPPQEEAATEVAGDEEEEETLGDEARGDVSARGFHSRRRVTIFDVRVSDTDAPSYRNKTSAKVLEAAEKEKCTKYEAACTERQRDFVPLVYSVDGLPGQRAKAAERRLAAMLAAKWERPYSDVMNFVRVRMSLSVVRSNTLLLRTERAKSRYQRRAPEGVEACMSGRGME